MIARAVQRMFAMGFLGMFGLALIPGRASASLVSETLESSDAAAEALPEQKLLPDEVAEIAAWGTPLSEASPMEVKPDFKKCVPEPYNCLDTLYFPFPDGRAMCLVVACGSGKCSTCPDFFSNIAVRGWCSYGCMRGKEVVGSAMVFKTRWGDNGPWGIDKANKIYSKDGVVAWPLKL